MANEDESFSVESKSTSANDNDIKNNTNIEKDDDDDDSKVEICRNFCNNRCNRGAYCKFRHPKSAVQKSHDRNRSRSPIIKSNENRTAICRDFIRNICNRGSDCRYSHPQEKEGKKKSWFTLCLDFQNGRCSRHDCRYFHITPEDEDIFRETGEVSMQVIDQAMQKAITLDEDDKDSRPTCKDYIKGICDIRSCRYRHVDRREYEDELYKALYSELVQLVGHNPKQEPSQTQMHSSYGNSSIPPQQNPYDMDRRSSRSFEGERRMGDPSFDNLRGGGGSMEGRRPYPQEQYPYSMRDGGEMRGSNGSPSVPVPSFPRGFRSEDPESLRRTCGQLRDDFYRLKQGKDNEISTLQRKLGGGGPGAFGGPGVTAGPGYDDLRGPSDGAVKMNRQLQMDLQKAHDRNEELLRELKANQNWEQVYNDAKVKMLSLQREKQEAAEKLREQAAAATGASAKAQAYGEFKAFVEDQVYKLQSQVLTVERELSQSWGGGPPPLASQREAWNHLKSLISMLNNPNLPSETESAGGYTSAPGGYTSAPGDYTSAPGDYTSAPGGHTSAPSSNSFGSRSGYKDGRNSWNGSCSPYAGGNMEPASSYSMSGYSPQAGGQASLGRMDGPSW